MSYLQSHAIAVVVLVLSLATPIHAQSQETTHMPETQSTAAYLDTKLSFKERAKDLVSRMTIEEKVSQMLNDAPAVERLGIPAYNWWNECLHGVARAGVATVFPQAIGLAATWDPGHIKDVGTVVSDEARAKHHEALRQNDHSIYRGLTFWTPNINIFRDPRWGRGHETYGEDPYLTSRIGVAFVKGLQGDDPKYLKVAATAKHYAVHSGPENLRHEFDAVVSKKDLRETYLPAFEALVREAKVEAVMGAYNRVNSEPACASKTLLTDILRGEWGFDGHVVSDCGAIQDIHANHKVTTCTAESAALSVRNGCDLECGGVYASLLIALTKQLVTEAEIDTALTRLFTTRMRLGMFDPPQIVPYAQIPYDVNDCEKHRKLARETARRTMVLLKNAGNLLPLKKDLKSIAVIGPNADSLEVLLGNYAGTPSKWVTPLAGIRSTVSSDTRVYYAKGCAHTDGSHFGFSEAVSAAQSAEVVVMCLGLTGEIEGEEGDTKGDRTHIDLPAVQQELLETICATGKPVVLVLMNGSALAINWAQENVPAILEAWYPGEEGGTAIADILFGDYSPAGRLPVTFVKSLDDLPPLEDYNMSNRTYKYTKSEPLYPFGFGLSYTKFEYSALELDATEIASGKSLRISTTVTNAGNRAGDEVVQLYLTDLEASVAVPTRKLIAFSRISLQPGESRQISFTITPEQMSIVDANGRKVLEPGEFSISLGGCQGDARSLALGAGKTLTAKFRVRH